VAYLGVLVVRLPWRETIGYPTGFSDEPDAERIVWLFSLVLGRRRMLSDRFVLHEDRRDARLRIYQNGPYAVSHCSRNIEMAPPCKIEMTLPRVSGSREKRHDGAVDEQTNSAGLSYWAGTHETPGLYR
jgi:hypothetical protein